MDFTGFKSKHLIKEPDNFLHCRLNLAEPSGKDQRTAKPVHKPNLNVCCLNRHIRSDNYCLPGSKPDHSHSFSSVILPLMNTNMKSQIFINTCL